MRPLRLEKRGLPVDIAALQELVERLRPTLGAEDCAKLETAIEALAYLQELVADQTMTMEELRHLVVVQPGTETLRVILRHAGLEDRDDASPPPSAERAATAPRPPAPGHGRRGAAMYPGARQIVVTHQTLRAGTAVRNAGKGKSTCCGSLSGRSGSWAKRRWRRPCTIASAYGAISATRYSRLPRRRGWGKKSTTRPPRA
jgi:hypothetical protein